MDIDSGNLSAVAQVRSKERGRYQDAEVVDLEKSRIEDNNAIQTSPIPEDESKEEDELPFSAARSISFVLALTGAAFLNVSQIAASPTFSRV
jgi:hypothetical protein